MSIDWTKSMQQTYEFYEVDPGTWQNKRKLNMFTSSSIERDLEAETLGSASFSLTENLHECYVRTYLVANQNGVSRSFPLGTHLVQTPSDSFDGIMHTYSINGYTPLIELKESQPPLGYSIKKGTNILTAAYRLTKEHMRATVIEPKTDSDAVLQANFVANDDDTWFSFIKDLLQNANYRFEVNQMGEILFAPSQETASLQPRFTYSDDNSSILLPSITVEGDLYSIPNVIEVCYSFKSGYLYSRMSNRDESSPISVQNRGREIVKRIKNPDLMSTSSQSTVDRYAKVQLQAASSLSYKVSYEHGFNEVTIGDCVRLDYERAGVVGEKAKVTSQSIKCSTGCTISETAIFTKNLCGKITNDYTGKEA